MPNVNKYIGILSGASMLKWKIKILGPPKSTFLIKHSFLIFLLGEIIMPGKEKLEKEPFQKKNKPQITLWF